MEVKQSEVEKRVMRLAMKMLTPKGHATLRNNSTQLLHFAAETTSPLCDSGRLRATNTGESYMQCCISIPLIILLGWQD